MREARIIMPLLNPQSMTHIYMQRELIEAFGGFTATSGYGGWKDSAGTNIRDEVMVYDIACDENRDRVYDQLFEIAMKAGRALNQQAVYIRYPNGDVEIADTDRMFAGRAQPAERSAEAKETDELYKELTGKEYKPGVKRTPELNEVWETPGGCKVATVAIATKLDGGYKVVVLSPGNTMHKPGDMYVVDYDGRFTTMREHYHHPLDLTKFVTAF